MHGGSGPPQTIVRSQHTSMVDTFTTTITPYGLERRVFVYLPDDWQTAGRRWPVVYMFDGHNLFFDDTATYGTCWGLKEYCDEDPRCIIVGVECNHEGDKRLEEYCPYDSDWFGGIRGTGQDYLRWLVEELKPEVDADLPTLPDRAHTSIAGSSMGGLMSIYAGVRHNDVFGRAGCLSPSVRACLGPLLADINAARLDPDTRFYLSWGEKEGKGARGLAQYTANALAVTRALQHAGGVVCPYMQPNGAHSEASWAEQVPLFMPWLLDERPPLL